MRRKQRTGRAGTGRLAGLAGRLAAHLARGAVLVALLALGGSPDARALGTADEYALKAAFLYQFTKYVSWPGDGRDTVSVCILGRDPFGPTLDETLAGKTAAGRPLRVRRLEAAAAAGDCHILFVSRSEKPRLDATLSAFERDATLTVADMEGFAHQGGMINLKVDEDRVRLEINPDNARRAGLKIRSELLRLADLVGN